MKELIKILNEATIEYDRGTPIMSDKLWDSYYFNLLELEKELGYAYPNSPTQKIHFGKVSNLNKITHEYALLSLAKTKEINEVNEFIANGKDCLCMCKMDGLTCTLTYENGELVSAGTRGNGYIGEDITHNAKVIPSIPKRIQYTKKLVVSGEIISTYENFENFKTEYKNPRNFAAGSIRLLDAGECYKRGLTFVLWDVLEGDEDILNLDAMLDTMAQIGFTTVPYILISNFSQSAADKIVEMAKEYSYPIDGVVIKYDDIEYGKSLGNTAHHFRNAIAYKFFDETVTTEVKYIEWTMGRTGVLTPVAVLKPIELDGSTIERANCHNVSVFKELGLRYQGQEVDIFKANQIIPQIAKVHEYPYDLGSIRDMGIPDLCPICGEPTVIIESDTGVENLYCENPKCEGKLINRLDHFCGKKGLDIKGLSKATLEKLINWGYMLEIGSVFCLNRYKNEWKSMVGFGEKSVEKILSAIEEARKNATFAQVLSSIGIPLIGSTVSKDLAHRFKTYSNFREHINKGFDFSTIDGYGPEMTKSLLTFDYSELDKLVTAYFPHINEESEEDDIKEKSRTLGHLTFVITGKLQLYKNRDALKAEIEAHGGKVSGSVSKNTDYLINNDINSTSSKNKKAQELGVPIITEEKFKNIFDL